MNLLCLVVVVALACGAVVRGMYVPNVAQGKWLDKAVNATGARCIDGSPPFYALRRASAEINRTKWYFHIEGGGWCVSAEDCAARGLTRLGSSDRQYGFNETMDLSGVIGCNNSRYCGSLAVPDSTINPLSHDWNFAYFHYCDGGSWTGDNISTTVQDGRSQYFRGFRNLNAILGDLLEFEGLNMATEVIIGGDSAGGLATWIHTDHIRRQLPPTTKVVGLPDSGFFLDYGHYHDDLAWVYHQMNATAGLHQDCVAHYAPLDQTYMCIFAPYTAPFCQTPMFALQGRFDSYQTSAILGSDDPARVNPYGLMLQSQLTAALNLAEHGKHAAFVDSCHHHCGYWVDCLGKVIDGMGAELAFTAWYHNSTAQRFWLQNQTFPCESCCNDGDCAQPPWARESTTSTFGFA